MRPIHLIPIICGAVAVLLVLWLLLSRHRPSLPYSERPSLLTDGELRFYRVLLRAVPPGLTVFMKVRLMDVVSVPDKHWQEHGAPGSGMHVDFVLADTATIEPRLVIELDDKSHFRLEVQKWDAFKDAALEAAAVPLLRVTVGRYEAAELRARIETAV